MLYSNKQTFPQPSVWVKIASFVRHIDKSVPALRILQTISFCTFAALKMSNQFELAPDASAGFFSTIDVDEAVIKCRSHQPINLTFSQASPCSVT
jgi:hypothetical protein